MQTDLACALLEALVATHRYGQPIPRNELLRISSYESHRGGEAKRAFANLRTLPFVSNQGRRGIMLNHSKFDDLARFLAEACGWSAFELRVRLKHFEGWENIDIE